MGLKLLRWLRTSWSEAFTRSLVTWLELGAVKARPADQVAVLLARARGRAIRRWQTIVGEQPGLPHDVGAVLVLIFHPWISCDRCLSFVLALMSTFFAVLSGLCVGFFVCLRRCGFYSLVARLLARLMPSSARHW